jgi:WD40 repeat protein
LLAVVTDVESDDIKVYRVGIDGDSPGEVCRIRGRYPLCFGPTGEWLLANRPGGGFLKANTRTGAIEREYQLEVETDPSAGKGLGWEISPNGQLAVWYDMRGSRVINLETGAVLFEIADSVARFFQGMWASFSPDGTRLAARGGDDQVRLWDVATARMVARLPDRGSFVRFSADGARLVVVSPERELSVLDGTPIETKEPTR